MSLGDVISRILFRRPSNLANQNDSVGRLVVPEHLEDVDEVQTSDGVSSDLKTCGLSGTRVSQIRCNFIRQRPASGINLKASQSKDVAGHDTQLFFAGYKYLSSIES